LDGEQRESLATDPRLDKRGDHMAGGEPVALLGEVDPEQLLDLHAGVTDPDRRHQAAPLPRCQPDHHDPLAVLGGEVTPERAVQVVAVPGALSLVDLHFGEVAQMPDRSHGHVSEGQSDELAGSGDPPLSLGG
jgi:hypothetical protein